MDKDDPLEYITLSPENYDEIIEKTKNHQEPYTKERLERDYAKAKANDKTAYVFIMPLGFWQERKEHDGTFVAGQSIKHPELVGVWNVTHDQPLPHRHINVTRGSNTAQVTADEAELVGHRHVFACTDAWRLGRPCIHENECKHLQVSSITGVCYRCNKPVKAVQETLGKGVPDGADRKGS